MYGGRIKGNKEGKGEGRRKEEKREREEKEPDPNLKVNNKKNMTSPTTLRPSIIHEARRYEAISPP